MTRLERPLLLIGCGKMGGAMLAGWLESGIAGGGVTVLDPMGAGVHPELGSSGRRRVAEDVDRDALLLQLVHRHLGGSEVRE